MIVFLYSSSIQFFILFRSRFWASLNERFYNAMVPNFIFNMPSKGYCTQSMGSDSTWRKWSPSQNCFGDLEEIRGVSIQLWQFVKNSKLHILLDTFLIFTTLFILFRRRIIQAADTADEFYCVMGQLSQEMLDYKLSDSNKLIKVSPFLFYEAVNFLGFKFLI